MNHMVLIRRLLADLSLWLIVAGAFLSVYVATFAVPSTAIVPHLGFVAALWLGLAALRILALEADQQARAVAAAEHLLALAKNRYQAGITTYLEVVTAQSAALSNQRAAVQLLTRRMAASVGPVEALGGGWRESDLPSRDAILARGSPPAAAAPAAATR